MKLLEIQASVRQAGSLSRTLSHTFITQWKSHQPNPSAIEHRQRDVGTHPPAHPTAIWTQANYTSPAARSPEMHRALIESETLIEELLWADHLVLGVPMYNFSVPSTLKAYLDNVIRINRTFSVTPETGDYQGLAGDKKTIIITPSAGNFTANTPGHHLNFCDPYLQSVLGFIGITTITVIPCPHQFADDPARARSTDIAKHSLSKLAAHW